MKPAALIFYEVDRIKEDFWRKDSGELPTSDQFGHVSLSEGDVIAIEDMTIYINGVRWVCAKSIVLDKLE